MVIRTVAGGEWSEMVGTLERDSRRQEEGGRERGEEMEG